MAIDGAPSFLKVAYINYQEDTGRMKKGELN